MITPLTSLTSMPLLLNALIVSARTLEPAAWMRRPLAPAPALEPSISINGTPAYPGCDVPSIVARPVMIGSGLAGEMVWTPAPGILNLIVLLGAAFVVVIASRNEPGPASGVFVPDG